MPPKAPGNAEELAAWHAEVNRRLEDAGGKITQQETVIADLTKKLREQDLAHKQSWEKAQDSQIAHGNDRDCVARYFDPDAKASGVDSKAIVSKSLVSENRPVLGSDHGVVRLLGCKAHGRWRHGMLDDPAPPTQWVRDFQVLCEERTFVRMLTARKVGGHIIPGRSPDTDAAILYHLRTAPEPIRRVFADNAGEGAEWIPDIVLAELFRKAEAPRAIEALFQRMNLPGGLGNTVNPYQTTGVQPFLADQPGSGEVSPAEVQQSVPTTSSLSNAARTLMVNIPANRDAEEDAIVVFAALARQLAAEALRDGREDCHINGDTGTHGDTGIAAWNPRSRWIAALLGTSKDHRYAWRGLRHTAIDASASVTGASLQSPEGLLQGMINLDSPHLIGQVAFGVSPEFYVLKLLVASSMLTVDKMGDLATLRVGQVGSIGGHPVVISEFIDKQYNASGIYDDSTKTKTGTLIVNPTRYALGVRSDMQLESETVARTNTNYLIAKWRGKLMKLDPDSVKSVAWLYNQDPS